MKYAAKSDKGKVRETNEDSYKIIMNHPNIPNTFIIADGMGGHSSGELASSMAVEFAEEYILKNPDIFSQEEDVLSGIDVLVKEANNAIFSRGLESQSDFGMGTTFIVVIMLKKNIYIGHVGDSRVYLIRDNTIQKLTTDHSYIEELLKNGSLTREEAENHPKRNIITRALGCEKKVLADLISFEIRDGDTLILCTDGLTNMLTDEEILDTITKEADPESSCDKLIHWANERGGVDNVTVIVIKNN
ncbi:MAG: Stp1/IreP family PP2C-type Ser/Thr phosphatase [Clostridium sp.]|nr:Stp1/IreP family PP2C-type Ser/Thr phosphatase [Clostridium sp.]